MVDLLFERIDSEQFRIICKRCKCIQNHNQGKQRI